MLMDFFNDYGRIKRAARKITGFTHENSWVTFPDATHGHDAVFMSSRPGIIGALLRAFENTDGWYYSDYPFNCNDDGKADCFAVVFWNEFPPAESDLPLARMED